MNQQQSLSSICCRCSTDIIIGSYFCTECGAPQIKNLLPIEKKTTANWDPTGPSFKPWKMKIEPPKFPSLYEKSTSTLKNPHPQAWCPPIKSKDKKKKKKNNNKEKTINDIQIQLQNILSKDGSELVTIDKNDPNIFYFRGQAFRYTLGNIESNNNKISTILENDNENDKDNNEENEMIDVMNINPFDLREIIMPIGIYEATWIYPYKYDYNVHLSLIERKRRDYSFQFWLRIGVSYEDPDGIRSDDLQVLDVITNTEGRLITPSNKDWVDINDINPGEHYMHIYLQTVMNYISCRVKEVPIFLLKMIDQNCVVTTKKLITNDNEDDEYMSRPVSRSLAFQAETPPKMIHNDGVYMKDIKTYRFKINHMLNKFKNLSNSISKKQIRSSSSSNQTNQSSSSSSSITEVNPMFSLCQVGKSNLFFDKTLSYCTCKIPMGPSYRNKYVLCQARLTVSYYNQAKLSYPLPEESNKSMNNPNITHIITTLFPYYSDVKIRPKTIAFEVETIQKLLPEYRHIDIMLSSAATSLKLLKSITRLLRYEYTIYGPKLLISGALCPRYRITLWPTDPNYININVIDEEILASAILLQKIWRSRIGKKKVDGIRKFKATIKIQRVIKLKVHYIRQRKKKEAIELERKINDLSLVLLPLIEDITFEMELKEILIFLQVEKLIIDAVFLYDILMIPIAEKQRELITYIEKEEEVRAYERKYLRIEDVDAKPVVYKESKHILTTIKEIDETINLDITGSFKIYYRDVHNPQARLVITVQYKNIMKQFIFIEHHMLLEIVKNSIIHQHDIDNININNNSDDDDIQCEKIIKRALDDSNLLSLIFETVIAGLEITVMNHGITIDLIHTEIMLI